MSTSAETPPGPPHGRAADPGDTPRPQVPGRDPRAAGGLDARYGRGRGLSRLVVAAALAAVAVLVLAGIYWATVIDRDKVTWQDYGYDVTSAGQVVVTFDVQLHGGAKTAVCTVHALNELNTEVGVADVQVTGGAHGRARMVVDLPTSERATTGLVDSCKAG